MIFEETEHNFDESTFGERPDADTLKQFSQTLGTVNGRRDSGLMPRRSSPADRAAGQSHQPIRRRRSILRGEGQIKATNEEIRARGLIYIDQSTEERRHGFGPENVTDRGALALLWWTVVQLLRGGGAPH
jgi:hypothetical protein